MPVSTKLRVPAAVSRVLLNVAAERVWSRPVRGASDVPTSADQLTTDWLSAVLCDGAREARVTGFDVVGGSDGTSSRRALRVTYNEAGVAAGLPTALFMKSAASAQSRLFLVVSQVTESETVFYRDIRPVLDGLRSPRAFHAASDLRRCRSVVLMEDMSAAGCTFPDPMHDTVSRRDAEDMVDQMAYYHGAFWDDERLTSGVHAALPTTEAFQQRLNDIGIMRRARIGLGRTRDRTPERLARRSDEILPATMRALHLNSTGTLTLVHQDVHHGNWLRDAEGRMGLYDWQAVAKGGWALDFSYAMSVNLTPDDRRAWEDDLLRRYLAALGAHGVSTPPSFAEAHLQYRQQPFHVAIFALLTIGSGRLQPDMQPEDYMMRCWERIATFIDDHQSLDSLEEPPARRPA